MSENMGTEIAKELAKSVYDDAGKAITKPTGELVGLVPRTVKAALAPLEKWILKQEYSVAETRKLLEKKLENIPPEQIEEPEPHIAIPAMQYISYCMDNEELREMYANLLANSMIKVMKNGVHPGFVEIIKQLCPDEARILRYMYKKRTIPTISLRWEDTNGSGIYKTKYFTNVGEFARCESPYTTAKYFDNLMRLGLVSSSGGLSSLANKQVYEPLKNHAWLKPYILPEEQLKLQGYERVKFEEGFMRITDYGLSFCDICLGVTGIIEES